MCINLIFEPARGIDRWQLAQIANAMAAFAQKRSGTELFADPICEEKIMPKYNENNVPAMPAQEFESIGLCVRFIEYLQEDPSFDWADGNLVGHVIFASDRPSRLNVFRCQTQSA